MRQHVTQPRSGIRPPPYVWALIQDDRVRDTYLSGPVRSAIRHHAGGPERTHPAIRVILGFSPPCVYGDRSKIHSIPAIGGAPLALRHTRPGRYGVYCQDSRCVVVGHGWLIAHGMIRDLYDPEEA